MNYTVYINNNCTGCERVIDFLKKQHIPCEIINIEKDNNKRPLKNGFMVYPALYSGENLVAYGDDIIQKLIGLEHQKKDC